MKKEERGYWMFKAPKELKERLNKVIVERVKIGKDRTPRNYKRIGLAISRSDKILNELINSEFMD